MLLRTTMCNKDHKVLEQNGHRFDCWSTTTTVATLAMKRPEAQSTMSQLVAGDLPIISDVVREAL